MSSMAALSMATAMPLAASAHRLTWANRDLQGAVGRVTRIAIGVTSVVERVFAMR